ncbi:MAG: DUF6151 family protein, partial [Paracoccaceae bacterium]
MDHDLRCQCGQVQWRIAGHVTGRRLMCYCVDCQAFQHHLGCADRGLDSSGGTDILQTLPEAVTLAQGVDHIAVLRLGPKGLLRWYATCCNTPIANTIATPKFAFAGMILPPDAPGFGPIRARVNTLGARTPIKEQGTAAAGIAVLWRAGWARVTGAWRRT